MTATTKPLKQEACRMNNNNKMGAYVHIKYVHLYSFVSYLM